MKKKESETVPTDVTEILSAAVKGLEYPSESDAPFEIFGWDAGLGELTAESLAIVMQKGRKGSLALRKSRLPISSAPWLIRKMPSGSRMFSRS